MKRFIATDDSHSRHIVSATCAAAVAVALMAALPQHAMAAQIEVPDIPANLTLPAGNHPFLLGRGVGTQNYVCKPSASSPTGVAYVLFTPQATLFNDEAKELITHFFSPNPFEVNADSTVVADGPIRVTWQATDTSTIWGQVRKDQFGKPESSTDPNFVKDGAVAWLKVTIESTEDGPTGGDKLTHTTFVHRLNTSGGLAPKTGCASGSDLGNSAFVPYTADYFFYTDQ